MQRHLFFAFLGVIILLSVWSLGCDEGDDSDSRENNGDGDSDTDTDSDGDGDSDGDTDSDSDADPEIVVCDEHIATEPIDPPVPDGCIKDASAGDHTFKCGDISFMLLVPERCTKYSCGLIVDVHGGTMKAPQMRKVTELDKLAPPCDYIVIHPWETSPLVPGVLETSQWHDDDDPKVKKFIDTTLSVFQIDRKRVHFTGFSLGGNMSWRFICKYGELFTSVAPIAAVDTCANNGLNPEFSILYMHGHDDLVVPFSSGEQMIKTVAKGLDMGDAKVLEDPKGYKRVRYENARGTTLDFIDHIYGGQAVLGGHCVPGGTDPSTITYPFGTTCTTPANIEYLHWGKTVLNWFLEVEGR
ncbi:MAG: hypothetical protein GY847_06660 [Proteobacteria bacterium]|nr:hypothetical protein [Pseudomonadota bacterium]